MIFGMDRCQRGAVSASMLPPCSATSISNAATRCQEFRSDRTLDHLLSHGSEARFSSIAVTSKRKVRTLEGQAGRSSQVLLRDLELCVPMTGWRRDVVSSLPLAAVDRKP